ncbi:MAG: hypothetical protein GYB68_19240 [Chloroflexi bacterium]|nr:hypothetical protein [Chloroflexota bacterium]
MEFERKYVAFSEDNEIIGAAMQGFVSTITIADIDDLLKRHHMDDIQLDQWYPMQPMLDLFSELEQHPTAMTDFVAIGMKAAEVFPYPPEVSTIGQVMQTLPANHEAVHRNGDIGSVAAEQLGERHWRVTYRAPHPPDVIYGIIYGLARRFAPPENDLIVRREIDGFTSMIDITW